MNKYLIIGGHKMFNEKKTNLNLYNSVESYNNSIPDIVIENVTVDIHRDGFLVVVDGENNTHIINAHKFVAIVY